MRPGTWTIAISLVLGFLSILAHAQQQFTERPTEYSSDCNYAYNNPPYAYDDNFSTASSQSLGWSGSGGVDGCETWFGFASAPAGATGMQLNIDSSGAVAGSGGGAGTALVKYSLDGGATFTNVYLLIGQHGSIGPQTNVVSLSNSQNLTKVQVEAFINATGTPRSSGYATQSIFEIWISGND